MIVLMSFHLVQMLQVLKYPPFGDQIRNEPTGKFLDQFLEDQSTRPPKSTIVFGAFGDLGMSLHLHLTGRSPSKWNPKQCKKQSPRGWGGSHWDDRLKAGEFS